MPLSFFLGMSTSLSMCVTFFRCESFPYISRRADWFPCALFPFHSPCTPLVFHFCPFHVPFSFPLFPFHFLLLSCHVDFLFPPLISLRIHWRAALGGILGGIHWRAALAGYRAAAWCRSIANADSNINLTTPSCRVGNKQ